MLVYAKKPSPMPTENLMDWTGAPQRGSLFFYCSAVPCSQNRPGADMGSHRPSQTDLCRRWDRSSLMPQPCCLCTAAGWGELRAEAASPWQPGKQPRAPGTVTENCYQQPPKHNAAAARASLNPPDMQTHSAGVQA